MSASPTYPTFQKPFPFRNLGLEPEGRATGRRFDTGEKVEIAWCDGKITALAPAPAEAPDEGWFAPPLFDPQVNGYGGTDFQQDGLTRESLEHAARCLENDGCGRILVTLITDSWADRLLPRLSHIRQVRESSPLLRRVFAGWHIEGPFLSPEPGFKGAHDPTVMVDPSPEKIAQLRAAAGDDPLMITVAPERNGSVEAIAKARELAIRVSFGHTNASAAQLAAGQAAGGSAFTHLGNGCPQQLDRHDNILWRVFGQPGLIAGIIPDGIHVSPSAFRVMHKALGRKNIYYTTDAMSAAGAPSGRYQIGRFEIEVGEDRIVRQPGSSNFAGSALRSFECVSRAREMLGVSWRELWPLASEQPAQWMGLDAALEIGALPPVLVGTDE